MKALRLLEALGITVLGAALLVLSGALWQLAGAMPIAALPQALTPAVTLALGMGTFVSGLSGLWWFAAGIVAAVGATVNSEEDRDDDGA